MRGATESICEVYQILFARSTNSVYSSNLHATSLSLIVPSEPPCYSFISVHSISLCPLHVVGLRYDFIFREKLIYDTLTKKPTTYLSVSNLSFIFAIKWHSICITNKYKAVMPQSQKYGGNREQITNKERL